MSVMAPKIEQSLNLYYIIVRKYKFGVLEVDLRGDKVTRIHLTLLLNQLKQKLMQFTTQYQQNCF